MENEIINEEQVFGYNENERMMYGVKHYEGEELMCAITGFDLKIAFNMRLINSLADAEACTNALADVFYEALMEQLIANKPDFIKQADSDSPILNKENNLGDSQD